MAINLTKKEEKVNWYYSRNGNQIGPFELSELVKQIEGDTMVWREGIEWTTARMLPELSSYFPAHSPQTNASSSSYGSVQMTAQNDVVPPPKKMFSAPFSFDGRIRRAEYGISLIIYVVAFSFLKEMTYSFSIAALGYIPLLWFLWAQGAKRCHDRNASGWFQLIPFYVFWMLFAEGDANTNSYGPNPN